jgi:hypothetical protein
MLSDKVLVSRVTASLVSAEQPIMPLFLAVDTSTYLADIYFRTEPLGILTCLRQRLCDVECNGCRLPRVTWGVIAVL